MKIRLKMFLVILPLIIATLALAQAASYFNAVNGITRLARQLLGFKLSELEKYADNQWSLLVENNYAGRPDMIEAAQKAVELYAQSIILSGTERIFAVDDAGDVVMSSGPLEIQEKEKKPLMRLLNAENPGLQDAFIGGERRVFQAFHFSPFQWYMLI
ncbi:MAG: adenylate/guanylate cyclase domain-containing protein, partial [Treponema sp.]|nr:adenylate/guanylate cyclase domain-containing protein [Treponema sp.]